MEFKEIYLDNAATTRVCTQAADVAYRLMTADYGNPGSVHKKGREARAQLDESRKTLADVLGCQPGEVYFTSCGSESDNWALLEGSFLQRRRGKHIISSVAEHDAVRKPLEKLAGEGWDVTFLKPDATGAVSPQAVAAALREDTVLVSLMLVNNETGAVTDLAGISQTIKAAGSGALLHTDAVQGFLKVPFCPKDMGVDIASLSGHKIHAPKGIGALYIRNGVKLPAHQLGGGQESGLRSGTEALPLIAAFAEAARLGKESMAESCERMAAIRQQCIDTLTAAMPDTVIIGGGAPHILSVGIPGGRSEVFINVLEQEGIYVSNSSACKRGRRSHVLEAMGIPPKAIDGALRISFSRFTTPEEADIFCQALIRARQRYFPKR